MRKLRKANNKVELYYQSQMVDHSRRIESFCTKIKVPCTCKSDCITDHNYTE